MLKNPNGVSTCDPMPHIAEIVRYMSTISLQEYAHMCCRAEADALAGHDYLGARSIRSRGRTAVAELMNRR